ncbi:cyclic nucleotide-binding domain-containing protein 2-like [Oscarella lobularis]|uniref:cyclic nucleotide-binding domain-containing protein 2-like n=1 Tax=Oscarella lobularis TaxID=121494 RepID=UPI003313E458
MAGSVELSSGVARRLADESTPRMPVALSRTLSVPRWAWDRARLESPSTTAASDSDEDGGTDPDSLLGSARRIWRRRRRERRLAQRSAVNFRTSRELRRAFRSAVLAVICMRRLSKSLLQRHYEKSAQATIADLLAERKVKIQRGGHVFDPDAYKSRATASLGGATPAKIISLSTSAKRFLRQLPHLRKDEHVQSVLHELRSYESFSTYPIDVQTNIALCGWFEEFGPLRVLVRQGHVPVNFYFLIKGSVGVSHVNDDDNDDTPESNHLILGNGNILYPGSQFGEQDILERKRRSETIVTKEHVQVLTVNRQVLCRFRESGHSHVEFIRHMRAFRQWPIDLFLAYPSKCELNYFRRGAVIVKSSRLSDTVYIVKSGSCDVVKKLSFNQSAVVNRMNDFKRNQRKLSLPCLGMDKSRRNSVSVGVETTSSSPENPLRNSTGSLRDQLALRRKSEANVANVVKLSSVSATSIQLRSRSSYSLGAAVVSAPSSRREGEHVRLDTLKPRDIFGLASRNQTECSLVSNGAECILIPRKFLLEHASTFARQDLELATKLYPTDGELDVKLKDSLQWEKYKSKTVRSFLET